MYKKLKVLLVLMMLNIIVLYGITTLGIYHNNNALYNINDTVKVLDKIQDEILKTQHESVKVVSKLIDLYKTKKSIDLVNAENYQKGNVLIYNLSYGCLGSGAYIQINEENYILTCAHLLDNVNDTLVVVTKKGKYEALKLIKYNKEIDLALFKIYNVDNLVPFKISDKAPKIGSEVIIIGNPAGIEDVITNGIISKINKTKYLYTNKIFFGNSGGCLLYKGKLVGINSQILILGVHPRVNFGIAVRLKVIKNFLEGI